MESCSPLQTSNTGAPFLFAPSKQQTDAVPASGRAAANVEKWKNTPHSPSTWVLRSQWRCYQAPLAEVCVDVARIDLCRQLRIGPVSQEVRWRTAECVGLASRRPGLAVWVADSVDPLTGRWQPLCTRIRSPKE